MPSRINNIFGKTEVFRRFRLEGESDGWAFYLLDLPMQMSSMGIFSN
ncbi:hypothetical protein H6G96_25900 [Nostoc sp. FACHB-892]|nr:hypothetical protein [Nostoc sp. FACHB-892]